MAEVADLIARIDTPTSEAVNELRVFKLENSLADEHGADPAGGHHRPGGGARRGRPAAGVPRCPAVQAQQPAAAAGPQADQRVGHAAVPDRRRQGPAAAELGHPHRRADHGRPARQPLLVSAPAESMELIEALIRQLDQLPAAEAQIKVFTIVNGDATSLADMLQTLFAPAQVDAGPDGAGRADGAPSRARARWCRCGSPSTCGPTASSPPARRATCSVVEAILLRLDDSDVRHRKSVVYRLKNSPASDVANAINQFLSSERQVQQISAGADQRLRADRARGGGRAGAGQQQPDRQRHAAVLRRDREDRRAARRAAADGDDPGADRRGRR